VLTAVQMNLSGADAAWVRGLGRTAPERAIKEHINCLEMMSRVHGHLENATQEAREYAQVFVAAYARNPRCFELPVPTPKVVAVLNLSGERCIVYSSELALARALTTAGLHQNDELRVQEGVDKVIQYAEEHACTLLLTLSLPWQATVPHLQWELHTLKRLADGTVEDGGCVLFKGMETPRATRSTVAGNSVDARVLAEQVEAMRVQLHAVCVDPDVDAVEDVDNEHRIVQLRKICAALQSERELHQGKLKEMEEKHVAELEEATRSADARMKRITFDWLAEKQKLQEQVDDAERQLVALRLDKEALLRERSEKASNDLREEQDLEKLTAAVKLAKVEAEAAAAAKEKAEETLRIERENNALARDAALSSHEQRLSAKTLEITRLRAKLEERGGAVAALETVVDRLRAEKEGLQGEMLSKSAAQERHVRLLRMLVAFARLRFEAAVAATATTPTGAVTQAAPDGAVTASTQVTPTPAAAPVVVPTADAASNTEPMQDDAEVLELRGMVQQLHAQLDAATSGGAEPETATAAAVGDGKADGDSDAAPAPTTAAAPSPASAAVADSGSGGDPAIDALLEQTLAAVHALARVAQTHAQHRATAERLQGEITGYQQMAQAALYMPQAEGWDNGYDGACFYNAPMPYHVTPMHHAPPRAQGRHRRA